MRKSEKKNQAYVYHLQEWTYQEIADELEVSKTTAYRWVMEQQNIRDTDNEDDNSIKKNEFGTETARTETSMTTNKHDGETLQHNNDNNSQKISNKPATNYDIELKKVEMEHEYRMAQLKLEEKRLNTSNKTSEFSPNISKSIPAVPLKVENNTKDVHLDIVNAVAAKIEASQKKAEQKKKIDALLERNKYLIPYDLKQDIIELINKYLELHEQRIRKLPIKHLRNTTKRIISKLRTQATKNQINVKSYSEWEPINEIDNSLHTMILEIDKSFFGSCEFEFPEDWIKELNVITLNLK